VLAVQISGSGLNWRVRLSISRRLKTTPNLVLHPRQFQIMFPVLFSLHARPDGLLPHSAWSHKCTEILSPRRVGIGAIPQRSIGDLMGFLALRPPTVPGLVQADGEASS
jgi:hypothetical protein